MNSIKLLKNMKGYIRLIVGPSTVELIRKLAILGITMTRTERHYVSKATYGRILIFIIEDKRVRIELPIWPKRYEHLPKLNMEKILYG